MDDIIDLLKIKIERAKNNLPESALNAIAAVDWRAVILRMREKRGYNFEQLEDLELETELVLCGLVNPKDYPRELEKRLGLSRAQTDELVNEMNKEVFSKIKEELIKSSERKRIFEKKSEGLPPLLSGEDRGEVVPLSLGEGAGRGYNSPLPPSPSQGEGLGVRSGEGVNHDTEADKKSNTEIFNSAGIEIINKKEESATVPSSSIPPREMALGAPVQTAEAVQPGGGEKESPSILAQKLSAPVQMPTWKDRHSRPKTGTFPLLPWGRLPDPQPQRSLGRHANSSR